MATRLPGQGWRAQVRLRGAVRAGDMPSPAHSLLLGDALHGPQGVWVADVAGQRLHQRVPDVCGGGGGGVQQGPWAHLVPFHAANRQPETPPILPPPPPPPPPSAGHLTSAHDACVGKVLGKDGSQAGQGLLVACRGEGRGQAKGCRAGSRGQSGPRPASGVSVLSTQRRLVEGEGRPRGGSGSWRGANRAHPSTAQQSEPRHLQRYRGQSFTQVRGGGGAAHSPIQTSATHQPGTGSA